MDASKPLAERSRPAIGWSRTVNLVNPLRAVWWLATNVRFAIVLLALLTVLSLLGVLIPQVPPAIRNTGLEAAWLDSQRDRYGAATSTMDTLGLFDVFHQRWFGLLLSVTVVSTGAYVVSRFPGIWQSIRKPRKRVPDRYLEMAPNRIAIDQPLNAERLELLLRARRYKVERTQEGGATYLFADRLQVAQLGTLLTHIAVIVFVLSAVVSRIDAFQSPLFLPEGSMLPVFPVKNPNQMQVRLENAYAQFAVDGRPLDYRSDLVVYERGEEALRCSTTVNTPCSFNGYYFYQEAYFGFGAAVTVTDTATGNVIYRETTALVQRSPSPRVRITDSGGNVLLSQTVVLPDSATVGDQKYRAGLVTLADGRPLTFWLPQDAGSNDELIVFEPGQGTDAVQAALAKGQTVDSGGLSITYAALDPIPSTLVPDFPLPADAGGAPGEAVLQMSNVTVGTAEISAGKFQEQSVAAGPPTLTIAGLQAQPVTLVAGESTTVGDLQYTFDGQREFAGINAKRDRSDRLIWVGAAMIVLGLMITFWVPRRRLWAKITPARTALAGQAPSHANYTRELRELAREAGGEVPEDNDDD